MYCGMFRNARKWGWLIDGWPCGIDTEGASPPLFSCSAGF